jgi:hypothetical protein
VHVNSGNCLRMFVSIVSGLRALQHCARGVQWCAYTEGPCQHFRFLSASAISQRSSKEDSASDGGENASSGSKGGGTSASGGDSPAQIVDPSKDASLQDLFVIPIKKPLIPGASLQDDSGHLLGGSPHPSYALITCQLSAEVQLPVLHSIVDASQRRVQSVLGPKLVCSRRFCTNLYAYTKC